MRYFRQFIGFCIFAPAVAFSKITAESYIVTDLQGAVLLEKNADVVRPIASITKLFTAKEALLQDQNELIEITREDLHAGKMRSTPLMAGKSYSRGQLVQFSLVSSDNVAAIALARKLPEIRTPHATLVEGSGLDSRNSASARQLALAVRELYDAEVAKISVLPATDVGRRRSTNPLLTKSGWNFLLSKTGFTREAGGCLAVAIEIKNQPIFIVILGSSSTRQRWQDLIELRKQLDDSHFFVPGHSIKKGDH